MSYSVKNFVTENPSLLYNDGVTTLFLNTKGKIGGTNELANLLKFFSNTTEETAVDSDLKGIHNINLGYINCLAIDVFRKKHAEKRGNSEFALSLSELDECIPDKLSAETEFEQKELSESINRFLASLSKENRDIFVCRYFYSDSIKEIASFFQSNESKIKNSLFRSRKILKEQLLKEGFDL